MHPQVGCFFGSIFTSIFGEILGRKKSIGAGVVVMILGALLQATAYTRTHMVVARIVSGFGMGIINSTVPVFQSEYSPKASRGLYACMQLSTLNLGIFLAYWIDYGFSSHLGSYAWRVPCILQCIFLIPMLFILLIVPETPRWLASHDRPDESLQVLLRLHKSRVPDDAIRRLHADILAVVEVEKAIGVGRWKDLFKSDSLQSRRRFLIACGIQSMQQLGGINAIIYYTATIFQQVGFDQHMSALMSGYLQTWFFVASFIPWLLIDRVGRRPLLLSMISLMAAVMAIQTALIYQVQFKTATATASGAAAAAMLFIFQGAFTVGFQATVWVYPTEILPLRLRQRGSSVSTACNWIFNYMIVQITPVAIENIGYRTYIIFAVLNGKSLVLFVSPRFGKLIFFFSNPSAAWVPIIYIFFPETKGLELEDVDRLFAKEGTETARMIDDKAARQGSVAFQQDKAGARVDQDEVRV